MERKNAPKEKTIANTRKMRIGKYSIMVLT